MYTSTPRGEDDDPMGTSFTGGAGGGGAGGIPTRQSFARNRQSYAFPMQQLLEEKRSLLDGAGDRTLSDFETTLTNNRRKTLGALSLYEMDYMSAMENLHHSFGVTIQSMDDRSQIFEVLSAWVQDVETASLHQRTNQTEISETQHRKLQNLLRKEMETWHLIGLMYFERLNVDDTEKVPFTGEIRDRFCINEQPYVDTILYSDPALREMSIILTWLENNYKKTGLPDLTEKNFIWENTLDAIRRDKAVGKPGSRSMVTSVDPDALNREGKQLHPLDDEENNKVLRGTYYYMRTGDPESAIAYLVKSGDRIKAAALSGYKYTEKTQANPETGEQEQAQQHAVLPSMEYLPRSKRQARPNPDFEIQGNPKRDRWKAASWRACERTWKLKHDRVLLGSLCGHRESMLGVAQNWEDRLWAFLKASLDVSIEGALRGKSTPNNREELPDSYWSQELSVAECIQKVGAFGKPESINTADYIFQLLQKCVMTDNIEIFLDQLKTSLVDILTSYEHPITRGHMVRFFTHLLLFFGIVDLPYSQELIDACVETYISVLVDLNQFVRIPFYVQKLSDAKKIPIIVHHVNPGHQLSDADILEFLGAAHDTNDLEVLNIAIAIVDKMRDEEDDFNVDNLNWIALCYPILGRSPQVMHELLKYTIWITRKYLTLGNIDKVSQLIGRLTSENVAEVTQLSELLENTLVREYICYKVYLEAEESLVLWKKAMSQKPILESRTLPPNATAADRVTFETRKKEHALLDGKWKKTMEYHLNSAIEKFLIILKFPGGWLRECYDPMDEDEAIHVGAVRRIVIKKVVHILLRLVQDKNDNRTTRDFVYILCDEKRNILKELSPGEIGNIFKVVENFTRANVSNIMFLPK